MAKAIFEKILQEINCNDIIVESAGCNACVGWGAAQEAREVIKEKFGEDLLKDHVAKSVDETDLNGYDLIIVMEEWQKKGLPKEKTFTIKEIAGETGNIEDPYGKSIEVYRNVADEIEACLRKGLRNILKFLEKNKQML